MRQLRPRRQGIPADHNYFAPYPNTIYRTTPAAPSRCPAPESSKPIKDPDEGEDVTDDNAKPKRPSPPKRIRLEEPCRGIRKRWRYFGFRRKRRSPTDTAATAAVRHSLKGATEVLGAANNKKKVLSESSELLPTDNARDGLAIAGGSCNDNGESTKSDTIGEDEALSAARCECCTRWRMLRKERRQSQRLVIKNYKLPFDELPDLCKLAVFSFLTATERGTAAQVCHEWRRLMRSPGLWSLVDFNELTPSHFNLSPPGRGGMSHSHHHQATMYPWAVTSAEYCKYCTRVERYFDFLSETNPHLQLIRFSFDLANPSQDWLKRVSELFQHGNCGELRVVDIDWTVTPVKPAGADQYCCFFNKVRVAMKRHIKRVLVFHRFFDELTRAAPMVQQASLPFNWSERSVLLLCRWVNLRVLRLDAYTPLQLLQQDIIDVLLNKLTHLQKLKICVSSPFIDSAEKRNFYRITHPQLRELDVAECKGIFLRSLNTPLLRIIRTAQYPWLTFGGAAGRCYFPPCLHYVLRTGAPQLCCFNNHRLMDFWLEFTYEELQRVLKRACPCKLHSRRLTE